MPRKMEIYIWGALNFHKCEGAKYQSQMVFGGLRVGPKFQETGTGFNSEGRYIQEGVLAERVQHSLP